AVGIAVAIEGAGFVNIFRDVFGSIPLGFLIVVVVVVLAFYIVIPRIFFPIAARRAAKDSISDLADRF
ncbi:MAG: hypothetical protein AAGB15_07825, partial [Pseudomonadota bacterium]